MHSVKKKSLDKFSVKFNKTNWVVCLWLKLEHQGLQGNWFNLC